MNNQVLYNIQQADEIRKLKEERDQLLKIHDKVCNQAAELLKACKLALKHLDHCNDYNAESAQIGAEAIAACRNAIKHATR